MIDYEAIIERFYTPGQPDYELLVTHSTQVANLAAQLSKRLVEKMQPIDEDFVYEAAMLHDIGMLRTNAPDIHCHGKAPYLQHGIIGREMLEGMGLFRHALVCERHTGAGLTANEIEEQNLPLPHRDLLPVSLEEKVVCYADNFYSKSHIGPCKSLERVRQQMSKYGKGTMERLEEMVALFGEPDYDKLDAELK